MKKNMVCTALLLTLFFLLSCSDIKSSYYKITKKSKLRFDSTLVQEIVPTSNGGAYIHCYNGLWYADGVRIRRVEEDIFHW